MAPADDRRRVARLREEMVDAVRDGRFHVWAVSSVDEGVEVLSGRPAGARGSDGAFPRDSVNAAVERTLAENVERLKALRASGSGAG
ncbi:MAG: hypothetical protein A2W08_08725 [Candidatus Rokubacteria bacterium RBG_16_73_20]|nr:MAG: hypothetical protein A2W08_08725 [Candidatus Rokubacteria bacterium RBG_16_73_20]